MAEAGTISLPEDRPRKSRLSVRVRLLAIALLPTLVVLPLFLGWAMIRWNSKFDTLLKTKVNGDLTIAHQYFERILENSGEKIDALGQSAAFRDAADSGDPVLLAQLLEEQRLKLGLDFLYLANGRSRVEAATPAGASPPLATDWPVIEKALAGEPATSVDIFSGEDLEAISPELAERARLDLVSTPNAVPTDRTAETRGMVVHSASPVSLPGRSAAALVGGILLNQNLVFIDTINDLVYRQASLPEGSQGTATLFLEDVRVSTNVRLFENRRALGTRVSAVVRERVLGRGEVWLDSAFVVNDWYISAYEPITDSHGRRVGMLYVGFLEAPFREAKVETLAALLFGFLVVTAGSVPIFLRWARGVFKPLEEMTGTIARVERGDLGARTRPEGARIRPEGAGDEIARVAQHLDHLLDLVQERDHQLRSWNEELNSAVEERTRDLKMANRQLEETTKQLIMSEKLAAIGEITAGVAHEINNPIAVIQGNMEVLRMLLGAQAEIAGTEIRLIDEQVDRINQIVMKLLQFAKPDEYAGYNDRHAPDDVISDCLPLVRHLLRKTEIEVDRDKQATRLLLMNRTELQQILINLIVNAIHAMPQGGTLSLKTSDTEKDGTAGVTVEVADTGTGMLPEVLARIFDPFYSTKNRQGTGLGLSITQTLVTRQGGDITVDSAPGEGTRFTIWLPEAAV